MGFPKFEDTSLMVSLAQLLWLVILFSMGNSNKKSGQTQIQIIIKSQQASKVLSYFYQNTAEVNVKTIGFRTQL